VPYSKFDPVTKDLLCRVHHEVLLELETVERFLGAEIRAQHTAQLTRKLLAAADRGERDFERLKVLALEGI
jgi:hypothetical protein